MLCFDKFGQIGIVLISTYYIFTEPALGPLLPNSRNVYIYTSVPFCVIFFASVDWCGATLVHGLVRSVRCGALKTAVQLYRDVFQNGPPPPTRPELPPTKPHSLSFFSSFSWDKVVELVGEEWTRCLTYQSSAKRSLESL